jgi:hypothetical protein
MENSFTSLREMFAKAMEINRDDWKDVIVSRESWLDIPIPQSYGDVSQLPSRVDSQKFYVWTQNYVYFLDCDDDIYDVGFVPRSPEAFRSGLKGNQTP